MPPKDIREITRIQDDFARTILPLQNPAIRDINDIPPPPPIPANTTRVPNNSPTNITPFEFTVRARRGGPPPTIITVRRRMGQPPIPPANAGRGRGTERRREPREGEPFYIPPFRGGRGGRGGRG